jgi:sirohydrochlorin cobaltochelatase
MTDAAKQGLILFAHGARDPRWAAPFETVAARVRSASPQLQVALAYLELMGPSLQDAGGQLVQAGCQRIGVLPMFLGAGGHVRRDLPVLVDALKAAHPQTEFLLHPPIGETEAVSAAMAQAALRFMAEVADRTEGPAP